MMIQYYGITISSPRKTAGFTLIEIVIVMVITSIISGVLAPIISRFADGYIAQIHRADLVERAQVALNQITREARRALPNSFRVGGANTAMEMIRTVDGGRYRSIDDPATVPVENFLDTTTGTDGTFQTLGLLNNCALINTGGTFITMENIVADQPVPGNIYQGGNHASIGVNGCINGVTSDLITFSFNQLTANSIAGLFRSYDTQRRFQIFDTPISYICNLGAGHIKRHQGYNIVATQLTNDAALAGISGANYSQDILVDQVSACQFNFNYPQRLLTVSITINDITLNESVTLMQQVSMGNT